MSIVLPKDKGLMINGYSLIDGGGKPFVGETQTVLSTNFVTGTQELSFSANSGELKTMSLVASPAGTWTCRESVSIELGNVSINRIDE